MLNEWLCTDINKVTFCPEFDALQKKEPTFSNFFPETNAEVKKRFEVQKSDMNATKAVREF